MELRRQYHFRKTSTGLDAWDVRRLIKLSENLPVKKIDPNSVPDIHTNHWYMEDGVIPSPLSIVDHLKLIDACDLRYPIILDAKGRVMDGMHRVCKALFRGIEEIDAVQFQTDPEPDYVNCDPRELPYDE